MEVLTQPTANLRAAKIKICTGDIALDVGLSLIVEVYNDRNIIIKSDRLNILELPNLKVGNLEVSAMEFLVGSILSESQLSLNTEVTPNPIADERGVNFFVETSATLDSDRLCIKPGEFDPSGTIKLMGELFDEDGGLVDRYIFAIALPDVIVDGQQLSVAKFIKDKALELFGLEEAIE